MTRTPYWEADHNRIARLPPGTATVTPRPDPDLTTAYTRDRRGNWNETGTEIEANYPILPTLVVHIPKEAT